MFSYVSLEQRVPQDHPLRSVRDLTDRVLQSLSPALDALYADSGRPSIAPEYMLRALLLQVFYSVRSERLPPFFERRCCAPAWSAGTRPRV